MNAAGYHVGAALPTRRCEPTQRRLPRACRRTQWHQDVQSCDWPQAALRRWIEIDDPPPIGTRRFLDPTGARQAFQYRSCFLRQRSCRICWWGIPCFQFKGRVRCQHVAGDGERFFARQPILPLTRFHLKCVEISRGRPTIRKNSEEIGPKRPESFGSQCHLQGICRSNGDLYRLCGEIALAISNRR